MVEVEEKERSANAEPLSVPSSRRVTLMSASRTRRLSSLLSSSSSLCLDPTIGLRAARDVGCIPGRRIVAPSTVPTGGGHGGHDVERARLQGFGKEVGSRCLRSFYTIHSIVQARVPRGNPQIEGASL